jgi:hypothetical protein
MDIFERKFFRIIVDQLFCCFFFIFRAYEICIDTEHFPNEILLCSCSKRRCCKLKKINAVLNLLMISDLHLKCKVKICGMNNNRLLYIDMYNMEIYCSILQYGLLMMR